MIKPQYHPVFRYHCPRNQPVNMMISIITGAMKRVMPVICLPHSQFSEFF